MSQELRQRLHHLSPEKSDHRRMKTGSEELSRISVIRSNNARRRKMRIRRQKSTCRTTTHVSVTARTGKDYGGNAGTEVAYESVEILLTFSSSDRHPQRTGDAMPAAPEEKGTRHVISGGDSEPHVPLGSCGFVSVIGKRREMEDAVKVELGFMDRGGSGAERYDFFGVFDGHGGSWVAEACSDRLHRIVAEEGGGGGGGGLDWEEVMVRCFGKMDEEVAERAAGNKAQTMKMVGSTAVVAVVGEEVVVVANCGDSRAVLSRGGVALALSADHKPDRPDELKRIEAAGGRVINWNGHRVLGVLATSRSIGDQHLKPYVIPEPEVTVTRRTPSDEFLIIASDGLWDVVSNEVACQVVRRCLDGRIKRRSPELLYESRAAEAAAVLAEFAMARGSEDNISVVVVKLEVKKTRHCSRLEANVG